MPDLRERVQTALGDQYQLDREIGRGGMATVFLAEDLKHQRPVAIKVLHPDIAATIGPARFRREIDIVAHLNHPHILSLLDSGGDDDLLWYAMPFIEGESLRERLTRESQLSLPDTIAIAAQVGGALDYAHQHEIVHRDIKPENILLTGDHAYVADFGIARALRSAEGAQRTSASVVVGTPYYMSPEQARGGSAPVDGRSDTYSLGCVVYEMLAGNPPFTGPTNESIIARHVLDRPPPLRTVRTTVPEAMEDVVARALAKVPADRYATTGAFAAALERTSHGGNFFTRRRKRATLLAGVAVAAVLVLTFLARPRNPPLNPSSLTLFPLEVLPGGAQDGRTLSWMLRNAINTSRELVANDAVADLSRIPTDQLASWLEQNAAAVARRKRSTYYVTGKAMVGDSIRIELEVHDLLRDTVLIQSYALDAAAEPYEVALAGAQKVVDAVLPTGSRTDLSAVISVRPDSRAATWRGETDYRNGRFAEAFLHFSIAVERDSANVWASLRGAQAASWTWQRPKGLRMATLALRRANALGPQWANYARGLQAYLADQPDSAVHAFRRALAINPEWAEAWMGLGEVYHHLLPMEGALLDSAATALVRSRTLDPEFAPPLFHLFQHAIWSGNLAHAAALADTFSRSGADSAEVFQAALMLGCARNPGDHGIWLRAVDQDPLNTLLAASWFGVAGVRFPACARAGWGAVLARTNDASDPDLRMRYGALVGSMNLAVLASQPDTLRRLQERLADLGAPRDVVDQTIILYAVAGADIAPAADSAAARLGASYGHWKRPAPIFHALGAWALRNGGFAEARNAIDSLAARSVSGDRRTALFLASLRSRYALAVGDTALALATLEQLPSDLPLDEVNFRLVESLAMERLLRAEILSRRGEAARALEVADGLDSPAAVGFMVVLSESLALRGRLAMELGDARRAERYAARRKALVQ
jgi:serine/threonine protein kinase